MDSEYYSSLSGSKDSEEGRDRIAVPAEEGNACSPPKGMVQMTVQNYMRSLHQFSEMPVLSRWNSVSSSHSLSSAPKSVIEWLDFWENDPVEILLDLGFGTDEQEICTKIPSRFISCASTAKGINIRVFIEAQRQRMDLENPNLCGRFRQLQVLDHVTIAFSSLLNDVSAMQHKMEEEKREEKSTVDLLKGKAVVTQAKRKKIGQLLRKASRHTTIHAHQGYRNPGPCKAKEDCAAGGGGVDLCTSTRAGISDNTTLVSLTEELLPNEELAEAMTVSQPITSSKRVPLPHLPTEQPQFPSTSETPMKDRPRKELNLLLTQTLRRVSSLSKKLSDSFEMEEIQSFEDEFSWGNPLGSTSDMIATRTSSCQSDSSGFLEDPSEPAPLQGLSLPGNMRLSYNSYDCQAFLRHRKDSSMASHDLLQNVTGPVSNISAANHDHIPLLASLSREHNFQGEEIFYSINEENDLYDDCSGQSGCVDSEEGHEMDEKEIQGRRGQLDKRDSDVEEGLSCCDAASMNQAAINTPERNSFSPCSEEHRSVGSTPAMEGCMLLIGHSDGNTGEDEKECEEEEEEIRDTCQDVLEAIAVDLAEEPHDQKAYGTLDSPIPLPDGTGEGQKNELNTIVGPLETTKVSQTQHNVIVVQPESGVISRNPLQDANQACHCFGKGDNGSLDRSPVGLELDEDGCIPGSEMNASSSKSVTVQMPSRLMSAMRSISLGETAAKGQSVDSTSSISQRSKEEPEFTSVPKASKGEDRQTKEASIQTDRSQRKKENLPLFRCLPSFHRHGHLVKAASLDTGLYWKRRSYHHEPLNAWWAQHRGHSCSLCSYHCCLTWPFTPSWRHPTACHSSHATTELQLLKTLQLLQDTTMRNISSCTVHEIEIMKNSCQKFRERLDEIEQHLTEQETLFSSAMSKEGREERRRLQVLRQAVRREVAELECQLQDRARQVREGMLMVHLMGTQETGPSLLLLPDCGTSFYGRPGCPTFAVLPQAGKDLSLQHLDQLLDEQACLCSALGISDWREEQDTKDGAVLPDPPPASLLNQASCSKVAHTRRAPSRSALVPPSSGSSLLREPELPASVVAMNQTSSASSPEEFHTSKKECKSPSPPKIDFKVFIQNVRINMHLVPTAETVHLVLFDSKTFKLLSLPGRVYSGPTEMNLSSVAAILNVFMQ
ncbi:protein ITPRID1 isoform X6 [Pogona vitticeps]